MGTLNYLVNHENLEIFALGKGLMAREVAEIKTEKEMYDYLLNRFKTGFYDQKIDLEAWAKRITDDMVKTIGLTGNVGKSDNDDELHDCYGKYTIVGSVYTDDKDIGKTYIESLVG